MQPALLFFPTAVPAIVVRRV